MYKLGGGGETIKFCRKLFYKSILNNGHIGARSLFEVILFGGTDLCILREVRLALTDD